MIDRTDYSLYGLYYDYDDYSWSCTSSDTSLSQCDPDHDSDCDSEEETLGLICYSPTQGKMGSGR